MENRRQRIVFRLVTLVAAPLVVLAVSEGVLRLAEPLLAPRGQESEELLPEEDPFLGFRGLYPVFQKKRGDGGEVVLATSPAKLIMFNDQEFPARKPPREFRVFTFGGSTVFGRPYDNRTSFSAWLELLLNRESSERTARVINMGGVSYASYRLIHLLEEALGYDPDLFIIYTGHNEFLERRTYPHLMEESAIRTRARVLLNRLASYRALRGLRRRLEGRGRREAADRFVMTGEVETILDGSAGLELYHRDPAYETAVLTHFRRNLERMIHVAREAGVPVILVEPPSNVKDFSPFKSEARGDLPPSARADWERFFHEGGARFAGSDWEGAWERFEVAQAIDSTHADLRYLRGQTLLKRGDPAAAERELVAALELDAAPLRATPAIRRLVAEVARETDVPLIPLERILAERNRELCGHPILGEEIFLDHAHPRIWVHQLLAELLRGALDEMGLFAAAGTRDPARDRAAFDSVMAGFDRTFAATRDLNLAKVLTWAGKRAEALPFAERAAGVLTENADCFHHLGILYQHEERWPESVRALERALTLEPDFARARLALGVARQEMGHFAEAREAFEEAMASEPDLAAEALYRLGSLALRQDNPGEAVDPLRRSLDLAPHRVHAHINLGAALFALGDFQRAADSVGEAVRLAPGEAIAHYNLGMAYHRLGELAEAAAAEEKALALNPGLPGAWGELGQILLELGQRERGEACLHRAQELAGMGGREGS